MFICQIFVWFVIYSIVGWIWESTYCTAVERTWQNRGFLYGPVCPIYGTGIVALMLLWHAMLEAGVTLSWYHIFFGTMIGSAILEYVTHWGLEKLFHAKWWDYSNMPLNLNGRICLPASVFFGLGGLLIVYVLYQPTVDMVAAANPLTTEALSLLLMAAIAADTAITASSLASIARTASNINTSLNAHMDQFVAEVETRRVAVAQDLDQRRVEQSEALQAATQTLRERREEAADRRAQREELVARERERFAESLRASRLGEMSGLARSAAKRAMGSVSPDRLPDTPEREQLAKLWRDMLDRS